MNEVRLFVVVAFVALLVEISPIAAPVSAGWREWLAADALPVAPEVVTAVELPGKSLDPLSAALALRAVLPLEPRGVVFLDPIAPDANAALLVSKLGDARVPVVFTAPGAGDPLANVAVSEKTPGQPRVPALLPVGYPTGGLSADGQIAARGGGKAVPSSSLMAFLLAKNIPPSAVTGRVQGPLRLGGALTLATDAAGEPTLVPQAARYVARVGFDELMVRTERSERGEIGAGLDAALRGRWVAVQLAGGRGAICLAALSNGLVEAPSPFGLATLGILLVVSVPLWPRNGRVLAACGASAMWALLALAFYKEFHFVAPLFPVPLLPLLAAARDLKLTRLRPRL
jgi:hypothetical protein